MSLCTESTRTSRIGTMGTNRTIAMIKNIIGSSILILVTL